MLFKRARYLKLAALIGRAHTFLNCLSGGGRNLIGVAEACHSDPWQVSRLMPLAFLSPEIINAVLAGTQPIEFTSQDLPRLNELPISWREQEAFLQF